MIGYFLISLIFLILFIFFNWKYKFVRRNDYDAYIAMSAMIVLSTAWPVTLVVGMLLLTLYVIYKIFLKKLLPPL